VPAPARTAGWRRTGGGRLGKGLGEQKDLQVRVWDWSGNRFDSRRADEGEQTESRARGRARMRNPTAASRFGQRYPMNRACNGFLLGTSPTPRRKKKKTRPNWVGSSGSVE
jgi:hypothetical protein